MLETVEAKMIERLIEWMRGCPPGESRTRETASGAARSEPERECVTVDQKGLPACSEGDPRIYFGGCC